MHPSAYARQSFLKSADVVDGNVRERFIEEAMEFRSMDLCPI